MSRQRGGNWIHEIKHDGYRCQVLLEGGRARVLTRTGLDWSEHYPAIVNAAANLDCQSAIIDGEAIIQDENGVSDFEALGSALWRCPHAIMLYAFDLMHLNGRDLRQKPLSERRWLLQGLLGRDDESRAKSSAVTVRRSLRHAPRGSLRASCRSSPPHAM
ncbi:MAG: ATP-dependent DNA ligase [Halobacteriota archaeon]